MKNTENTNKILTNNYINGIICIINYFYIDFLISLQISFNFIFWFLHNFLYLYICQFCLTWVLINMLTNYGEENQLKLDIT